MRVDASKIDHSRGNTRKSLTVSRITALPVPPLVHIRSRRSSLKSESCLPDRFARRAREFLPHPFRLNAIYTPVKSLRRSVVARQRCVYARYRTRSYKYTKFPRQFYSIFLSKLDEREKAEGFKDSREDERRDKLKGKTLTWPMIFTRWSMTVLLVKHAPPWASLLVDDPFPWLLVIVDLDSIEDRGGSSRLSLPAIAIYVNTARFIGLSLNGGSSRLNSICLPTYHQCIHGAAFSREDLTRVHSSFCRVLILAAFTLVVVVVLVAVASGVKPIFWILSLHGNLSIMPSYSKTCPGLFIDFTKLLRCLPFERAHMAGELF